jgi:endonuclease/exonuclease/phosphatase (EEP) superfamily protein YafD
VRSFRVGLRRITAVALPGLFAASLAAALAPLGWPFELFAHFRWQLGVAAVLLTPLAFLCGARWAVVMVITLGLQAAPLLLWPRLAAPRFAQSCAGPAIRVTSVNLWFAHPEPARLLRWLEAHPADVLVLQEVTPAWRQALATLDPQYPHRALRVRTDAYGIGVLSRWPFKRVETLDLADDGQPSLLATLDAPGQRLQVIAVHTHWPVSKRLQVARDLALTRAAVRARQATAPTVLAGDLNLTPYAPAFDRLQRRSGLRDVQAARGWRPTWLAGAWPLALPIDHVLAPEALCVLETRVGPDVGSDHRPVAVTLRLP